MPKPNRPCRAKGGPSSCRVHGQWLQTFTDQVLTHYDTIPYAWTSKLISGLTAEESQELIIYLSKQFAVIERDYILSAPEEIRTPSSDVFESVFQLSAQIDAVKIKDKDFEPFIAAMVHGRDASYLARMLEAGLYRVHYQRKNGLTNTD